MDMPSQHAHAGHAHDGTHDHEAAPKALDTLKDPVCGMKVTAKSEHHVEHEGHPYYFCSTKCLTKFSADPQKYATGEQGTPPSVPA